MGFLLLLAFDDLASGAARELVVHVTLADQQDGGDGAHREQGHGIEQPLQGYELPHKAGEGGCHQIAGVVEHLVSALPLGIATVAYESERQRGDARREDRGADADENLEEDNRQQRRKHRHEHAGDRDDERGGGHHQPLLGRCVDQCSGRGLRDDHGDAHGGHRHADRACIPLIGGEKIDAEIRTDAVADVGQEEIRPVERSERALRHGLAASGTELRIALDETAGERRRERVVGYGFVAPSPDP